MGYSVGFIRSYLALVALACIVALVLGGVNELAGLGLFSDGYPSPFGGDRGFGGFAATAGVLAAVAIGLSLLLERWE